MNKLTKAQEKRFNSFFGTGEGRLDDEPEARWWSEVRVKAIKQHLADELSRQREELFRELQKYTKEEAVLKAIRRLNGKNN